MIGEVGGRGRVEGRLGTPEEVPREMGEMGEMTDVRRDRHLVVDGRESMKVGETEDLELSKAEV